MFRFFLIYFSIITIISLYSCHKDLSPKEKAFELVKNSNVLSDDLPVKRFIEEWVKENKNEVKSIGWKAMKKNDKVYLINYHYKVYSFDEGTGERVFSFEVDLDTEIVRDVTKEVERRMLPLAKPFQDEREISEELMKQLNEEGEFQ